MEVERPYQPIQPSSPGIMPELDKQSQKPNPPSPRTDENQNCHASSVVERSLPHHPCATRNIYEHAQCLKHKSCDNGPLYSQTVANGPTVNCATEPKTNEDCVVESIPENVDKRQKICENVDTDMDTTGTHATAPEVKHVVFVETPTHQQNTETTHTDSVICNHDTETSSESPVNSECQSTDIPPKICVNNAANDDNTGNGHDVNGLNNSSDTPSISITPTDSQSMDAQVMGDNAERACGSKDVGDNAEKACGSPSASRRSAAGKSSSLNEADLDERERPMVERRESTKSVKSANGKDEYAGGWQETHEEMLSLRRRSESVLEYKEHAHCRLQEELLLAQQELALKDEEVTKLARVREQMSQEIEELTASLFEEANKMVQDAHIRRMQAEKLLKEANSKIDMLQAEVGALKTLIITSTPSAPNPHLNPQITGSGVGGGGATGTHASGASSGGGGKHFVKGHRRSTSHHNISREISLSELKLPRPGVPGTATCGLDDACFTSQTQREVEPEFFKVFTAWREKPNLSPTCQLLKTLFREDVMPCMAFTNHELAKSVLESVINNTLNIEPVQEKDMYRKCVLTNCNCMCRHRIKLKDGEDFIYVSQIARNRIAAVCDLFTYLRYIVQGLVKSNEKDIFWEITRLRKQMCLAKLGYVS